MRPTHAGVRATEGGGHVFFTQVFVAYVRACVYVSMAQKGRGGCRYFISVVTSQDGKRCEVKRKGKFISVS